MSTSSVSFRALWLVCALAWLSAPVQAEVVLDFEDISIPGGTDLTFFEPYREDGFVLTATNPPTGFSGGFQAHGPNSIFFAGSQALAPLAPTNAPLNLIELVHGEGLPFDLLSIDLARNFPFDPAPSVTFTGIMAGGGTVTQTFTVTTPVGVPAFQTFEFTGFTNLVAVQWGQPVLSQGLHQFDNIRLEVIPEPSTWCLFAIGMVAVGAVRQGRRKSPRTA